MRTAREEGGWGMPRACVRRRFSLRAKTIPRAGGEIQRERADGYFTATMTTEPVFAPTSRAARRENASMRPFRRAFSSSTSMV